MLVGWQRFDRVSRCEWSRSGLIASVALAAGLGIMSPARAQQGPSEAEEPALSKRLKRIDENDLLEGRYPLREITEVGRHLFTTPFTKADGYGEGGRPDGKGGFEIGPREAMFREKLEEFRAETRSGLTADELRAYLNFPKPEVNPNTKAIVFPYLRMNGLDSQSCFECHDSIGSARLPDTRTHALTRKQSTVGGSAGFVSTAFINEDLPKHTFMFVRNPPHVFGTAYAQELAEEMTQDLHALRAQAVNDALSSVNHDGSRQLMSKGVDFGTISVTYTGNPAQKPDLQSVLDQLNENPNQDPPGFTIDRDNLAGISVDLVVRPFQWKGIASNERNFVRDAFQFHFGMEAREKNPGFNTKDEDHDQDKDGVKDELTLGDVSALTIYTMTIRPPFEVSAVSQSDRVKADRGRTIFRGEAVFSQGVSCARCHTPSLPLNDQVVVVHDPIREMEKYGPQELVGNRAGLSTQVKSSAQLPAVRRLKDLDIASVVKKGGAVLDTLRRDRTRYELAVMSAKDRRKDGYAFNLTTLQPANADPVANQETSAPMSQSLPRLPAGDKGIDVPLFSDLRRHKMGKGLKERDGFRQKTDAAGIAVPEDEFMTRPLWGVGDTGPWLHDGRAQSLKEAILLHESDGSEANDVIEAFRKLSDDDQEAIVAFLLTLRLPVDPRYGFDDYR